MSAEAGSLWGGDIRESGLPPRVTGGLRRAGVATLGAWVESGEGAAAGEAEGEDRAWARRLWRAARRLKESGEGCGDFAEWLGTCLPERLGRVVRRRYALEEDGRRVALHERALSVVGRELGVGRERARQLAGMALEVLGARLPRALTKGFLPAVVGGLEAAGGALDGAEAAEAGAFGDGRAWGGLSAVGGLVVLSRLGGTGVEEYRGFFTTADRRTVGAVDEYVNLALHGAEGWVDVGRLGERWARRGGGDAGRLPELLTRNGTGTTATLDGRAGRSTVCTALLLEELLAERSPQGVAELTAEYNRRVHAGCQKGRGGIRAALLADPDVVRTGPDRYALRAGLQGRLFAE